MSVPGGFSFGEISESVVSTEMYRDDLTAMSYTVVYQVAIQKTVIYVQELLLDGSDTL